MRDSVGYGGTLGFYRWIVGRAEMNLLQDAKILTLGSE